VARNRGVDRRLRAGMSRRAQTTAVTLTKPSRRCSKPTSDVPGDTEGRSFSDCDETRPIGYSSATALGTRADDE
jgi:hypothetical protein